jgi:hypothetical protein
MVCSPPGRQRLADGMPFTAFRLAAFPRGSCRSGWCRGIVRTKSAPKAAAGLSAPDGDRARVSSTARMLAVAVKASPTDLDGTLPNLGVTLSGVDRPATLPPPRARSR